MNAKNHHQKHFSRRDFLKTGSTALGAIALPTLIPASAFRAQAQPTPGNRITLGVIGSGNQGLNDIRSFLRDDRVQIVAICDVNRKSPGYWNGGIAGREPGKALVEEHYAQRTSSGNFRGVALFEDFREMLARKDIDAVLIDTPDHWHALQTVAAAQAGKDIYCQKPLSLTIADGRAMSDAVKKYQRILQTGSQQRSDPNFRRACELVRNGRIGKLHTVKCGLPPGRPDFGKTGGRKQPEPVPEGFNYDLWLGPAPDAPYAPARTHVNFRWIYDYSGGQVTDWGGHHPDIAQWGMGAELTGPVAIKNAKGLFPPDELWDTATEYHFECHYENGLQLIISSDFRMGVTFEGSDGSIWVTRNGHESNPASIWDSPLGENDLRLYESNDHFRNFIDCVISRNETVAPAEVAHRSITVCHLGNIAMLLGRDLKWDPAKEQIIGDNAAQWMLNRPYRAPWKLEV
jgi:predicted dehydrogenase